MKEVARNFKKLSRVAAMNAALAKPKFLLIGLTTSYVGMTFPISE